MLPTGGPLGGSSLTPTSLTSEPRDGKNVVPGRAQLTVDYRNIPGDDPERCADFVRPFLALYAGGMGARGANFHFEVFARMGYGDEVEVRGPPVVISAGALRSVDPPPGRRSWTSSRSFWTTASRPSPPVRCPRDAWPASWRCARPSSAARCSAEGSGPEQRDRLDGRKNPRSAPPGAPRDC